MVTRIRRDSLKEEMEIFVELNISVLRHKLVLDVIFFGEKFN